MKILKVVCIIFIYSQSAYGQNVGIGTSNPNSTLTVTEASSPTIKIGGTQANTINSGTLIFAENIETMPYTGFSISHDAQNDKLNFRRRLNSTNYSLFDFRNNNEMHIHGNLYTQSIFPQNIRLASGASNGAILTSDADGDMEWSDSSNFNNIFKVNGTAISNENNYDKDFIVGRDALPLNLNVTDNFLFFDKDKAAFRAGILDDSDSWGESEIGLNSFAFGKNNKAKGNSSTAWGQYNTAIGGNSTVFGSNNSAGGDHTTVFGTNNSANGSTATVFGHNNSATGIFSTVFGGSNIATGRYSTAFGNQNSVGSYNEVAFGSYNTSYNTASGTTWNINDRLIVIGSGTADDSRKDALALWKSGKLGIGESNPESRVHIKSNSGEDPLSIYINTSKALHMESDGKFLIGDVIAPDARIQSNALLGENPLRLQIAGITKFLVHSNGGISNSFNTPDFAITLRNSATDLLGRGRAFSWNTYSDSRIKSNIRTINYGLSTIMKLRPTSYAHHNTIIDEKSSASRLSSESTPDIGLIAQEVYKLVPEAVSKPAKAEDLWSMDYTRLVPVLIKGMQEQQGMIEQLKNEIIDLKKEMTE